MPAPSVGIRERLDRTQSRYRVAHSTRPPALPEQRLNDAKSLAFCCLTWCNGCTTLRITRYRVAHTENIMTTISKYDDRIDSRDVIERIDELRDIAQDGDMGLDDTECEELAALEALAEQCEG